ncbi:hypothetical protein C1645_826051 [Glomus cerebriforme]|uniref:Tryptophan-rich sensory protein n=1 Tax=Glomus cerebriforme TaxID=658196 RepID=A0A397T0H0_9GLOM|nr:hypothetical protein C1645_826051 [Glomus cerebriforme]
MSRYNLFLRASNVVAFILVIIVNSVVHVNYSKKPDEPVNNSTRIACNWTVPETHLLPADYTFGIWGLIYGLLFGFVIYQWFEAAETATVEGIKFYYVIASVLNISWLLIWSNKNHLGVIIDSFVLAALCAITFKAYDNVTTFYPPKNLADRLFIHYPFTIYAAWALVATVLNFWVAFSFLDTVFLSTFAVICLGFVGHSFVDYHKRHDVVFAATIAWALVGIAVRQQDTLAILIASSVSSGLILGGILRVWVNQGRAWLELRRNRLRGIDETDPLIP